MEQPHAEVGLEPRDVLADAGRRQAEDARRGREAAVLGGLHEGHQVLHVRPCAHLKPRVEADCIPQVASRARLARGHTRRRSHRHPQPQGGLSMRARLGFVLAISAALCCLRRGCLGAGIRTFPASRCATSRPTAPRSTSARAAPGRRSCCCTATARPATCGRRSPPTSRATTPSIVPDLRGMGLSSKPTGGFDKKTQAEDVDGVLTALGVQQADVVAHDIGNMVAFQFAARHPERVRRLVLIDAPVPGRRARGRRFSRTRCSGTSASADPTWSAWSPVASGSTSTASGTSSRPRPIASARPRAGTTRSCTRCRARCTPASRSSPRSTRTRSTTASSWRAAG